ncbi:hypothetical protein [Marinobacter fonticola]|uniref:hypothetical protein n=1 Tax=Marinobacter fonticola TaxID=2603215 RepID=UPI0011E691BD|nr:hypothetical protein [Marinobacter fonticola]
MTEKNAKQHRPAVVCRPTPKPDITERRKSLRQGDQLIVAGSRNSFVLEVSSPEPQHTENKSD